MEMQWISVEDELPPEDGYYHVTNNPCNPFDGRYMKYDGYGFCIKKVYIPFAYWKKKSEKRTKVYGVIKHER
jgi:hypothetical protein